MGIFKDVRADVVGKEAVAAAEKGRRVFFARLDPGFAGNKQMPGSIAGMAEQIEAIEAAGWKLDQMSWTDKPEGYFLFRR